MKQFQYVRPTAAQAAIAAIAKEPIANFIAGGTNLLDLMKRHVMQPDKLVDINRLPMKEIKMLDRSLSVGALALNSTVAEHQLVKKGYDLLSHALEAGASAQLRNMATVGGNLMQRTRCPYFYDTSMPCNKRVPGTGCSALKGYNRMHAIFGANELCIAVNPSDMNVALAALDAKILASGLKKDRVIDIKDFHRLPGEHPEKDTNLEKNELITAVHIPANNLTHVHYLKLRDRASYAFALISVAVGLELEGKTVKQARLAMGGVAHKPWRLTSAEQFLQGKEVSEQVFAQAAQMGMEGAKSYGDNDFKLKLGLNSIKEALVLASAIKRS